MEPRTADLTMIVPRETYSRATTLANSPTPGCGSSRNVACTGTAACTPILTVALFIAPKMETARCPSTDEWIKKRGADTTWNFINPQVTKLCDLQENG